MEPLLNQPTGTITFLFTDIEGSTKLWEDCPEAMRLALAIHDSLLRQAIEQNNGYVFKTVGDAFCAAFPTAPEALTAANDAHFALLKQDWGETGPIRVRMGLHTGDAEVRDNDYFGPTLNRAARLQSIAYGCQTLLSQPTYELVRDRLPENVTLNPLGLHRLKDLNRAETVYQVVCPGLPSEFPALKSLESFPNNLPIQLTSFIGREREMSEIKQLLKSNRLVTLLGTGGTGKSRLSLQVGADLLEQFPDGIWFVELAPLTDSSLVPQVVASVIGVREEAGRTISHVLAESLRQRTVLIILDNCEHMLDATARLAQSLLQSCPHLTVLASSREAFTVPGEMVFRVPSLSQPEAASRHTAASLSQFEAVRLFIDRAASVNAEFAVTNSNAPALAQLCARLDGIPLAIELAAARARSLSVEEITGTLDHCFRILTGGSRTALPRQQTLRALVDWSYDLLSDPEKTLLRRVSVFYDGWTLEAAEQVCAGGGVEDWEALDLLTSLRDKSLAVTEQENGRTRYRLLETIRQYARDRLLESGEAESVQSSHYEYFNRFVEVTSVQLFGAQVQAGLDLMRGEHGNLRAALEWVIGNRAPTALRMPVAMGQFWYLGGYLREGREYLEQALASAADLTAELEGQTCFQIGRLASEQGDYGAARTFLERGLSCSQQAGDKRSAAGTLNSLGGVVFRHDDYTLARSCFEQALRCRGRWETRQG